MEISRPASWCWEPRTSLPCHQYWSLPECDVQGGTLVLKSAINMSIFLWGIPWSVRSKLPHQCSRRCRHWGPLLSTCWYPQTISMDLLCNGTLSWIKRPTTISVQRKACGWQSLREIRVRMPIPRSSKLPECTWIHWESSHSPVYCHLVSSSVTTWICCWESQVLISSSRCVDKPPTFHCRQVRRDLVPWIWLHWFRAFGGKGLGFALGWVETAIGGMKWKSSGLYSLPRYQAMPWRQALL